MTEESNAEKEARLKVQNTVFMKNVFYESFIVKMCTILFETHFEKFHPSDENLQTFLNFIYTTYWKDVIDLQLTVNHYANNKSGVVNNKFENLYFKGFVKKTNIPQIIKFVGDNEEKYLLIIEKLSTNNLDFILSLK